MKSTSIAVLAILALATVPLVADVATAEPFGGCGADTTTPLGVAFSVADAGCNQNGALCAAYANGACVLGL